MRRIQLFIVLLVLVLSVNAQEYKFLKPNLDDSCTIIKYLVDEANEQEFLVYLDRKTWTENKKVLANFSYAESELNYALEVNKEILQGQKTKLIPLKLLRHWLRPIQYKGEIMFYLSNEYNAKFILTDSFLVQTILGGTISRVFLKTEIINNEYHIQAIEEYPFQGGNKEFELIIHLIDDKKGLYVWEFKYKDRTLKWPLVPVDKIKYYPLIDIMTYDAMIDIAIDIEEVDVEPLLKKKN